MRYYEVIKIIRELSRRHHVLVQSTENILYKGILNRAEKDPWKRD